jgi:hypothetical protein
VNKQRSQRFHRERFNLKKLNEVEGKMQFRVDVSNRFAALEELDVDMEIIVLRKLLDCLKISCLREHCVFALTDGS